MNVNQKLYFSFFVVINLALKGCTQIRAVSNHPFPLVESKLTKTAILVRRFNRLSVLIL